MAILQLLKRLFASDKLPSKIAVAKDTGVFDEILAAVQTAANQNGNPELKIVSHNTIQKIWVVWEENSFHTFGAPGVLGAPIFQLSILENGLISVFQGAYGPTYTLNRINESILSTIRDYHLYG